MNVQTQKTIRKELEYSGIGLHTGEQTHLVFKPAPVDTGITFVREDLPNKPRVKACLKNVNRTLREVSLKEDEIEIRTVEHLLSALAGLGIENIEIGISGCEVPIGDGSAIEFVNLLKNEVISQNKPKKIFISKIPLWVSREDKHIIILPSNEFRITYAIDFQHSIIKKQVASFVITEKIFEKEIAPARTFGFLHEIESLYAQGLAKGGSLQNAIIIGEDKILNDNLRFEDEFVRHKILDLIGDLSLLGMSILGHIIAIKSGHDLNLKLLYELLHHH